MLVHPGSAGTFLCVDLGVFTSEIESEGYKDNGQGIIEDVFVSHNGNLISHND
jgi:hypothetical protein